MNKTTHKIWLAFLSLTVIFSLILLAYQGYECYLINMEERFYHHAHDYLKPSGALGHGYGIIGSFLILFGVFSYMARKRYRVFFRIGHLKHWLEFHIFLCVEGSLLILFHTAFKFGGIVSISFWSMVIVVLSGVIGRFIYIQIPRNIEGKELNLSELILQKNNLGTILSEKFRLKNETTERILTIIGTETNEAKRKSSHFFREYFKGISNKKLIRQSLRKEGIDRSSKSELMKMIAKEITLNRRIYFLQSMKNLFKLWHVAHLPFALIMLLIMVIHVVITLLFGYKWIF